MVQTTSKKDSYTLSSSCLTPEHPTARSALITPQIMLDKPNQSQTRPNHQISLGSARSRLIAQIMHIYPSRP